MRFSVDWIDGGMNRAAEERATVCDLGIYIGDQNACHFIDYVSNEEADSLVVPAVHVAEGIAANWWIIFGGRDRAHGIRRYRNGFALPDLFFRTDGATFEVTSKAFYSENPHLRFPFRGRETLPRVEAEMALSHFIDTVVDRLTAKRIGNSEVAECWSRIVESRSDPDEQAFCEAAGALGVDPYTISDHDARFIEDANSVFSEESLIEFLAGVRTENRSPAVAEVVRRMEARPAAVANLPELGGIARQIEHVIRHDRRDLPWEVGYRGARAVRQALGVTSGDRFASHVSVANRLGAVRFEPVQLIDGVRALVSRADGETRIHLHNHRETGSADVAEAANNFAFARAVGDAACFRSAGRSVVNDLHYAERQATGRAFAAEFLAPVESVVAMWDEGCDMETIADEFSVSSFVIEKQIVNQHRIKDACSTFH